MYQRTLALLVFQDGLGEGIIIVVICRWRLCCDTSACLDIPDEDDLATCLVVVVVVVVRILSCAVVCVSSRQGGRYIANLFVRIYLH